MNSLKREDRTAYVRAQRADLQALIEYAERAESLTAEELVDVATVAGRIGWRGFTAAPYPPGALPALITLERPTASLLKTSVKALAALDTCLAWYALGAEHADAGAYLFGPMKTHPHAKKPS